MVHRRLTGALAFTLSLTLMAAGCGDGGEGGGPTGVGAGKTDISGQTGDVTEGDNSGTLDVGTEADAGEAEDGGAGDAGLPELDGGADSGASDDISTEPDATVSPDAAGCPGGEGCPCTENNDCDNSVCLDTADGKRCAKTCVEDCPSGFTCGKLGAADATFVCIPTHLTTCSPCTTNADCQYQQADAICLDYGDVGKFCGGPCKTDKDCPTADYACISVLDESSGQTKNQCKLKKKKTGGSGDACTTDSNCAKGETCVDGACVVMSQPACGCSVWATTAAKSTPCKVSNEFGACAGTRSCGTGGLNACSAKTPAEETCNSVDDDCDGTTDNLPATVVCSEKAWLPLPGKVTCTSDADCSAPGAACETTSGLCKKLIGSCPGKPTCEQGKIVCKDAKTPKIEACNGADDDCDGGVDEDFTWTHPVTQKPVAIGELCGVGPCKGGSVQCETLLNAACTTELKKKAKETCNGVDDDCDGKTDDEVCVDGSECTADVCDGKSGTCSNPATVKCDDNNACTTDSCDKQAGKCVFTPYQGSCDDGDACTEGDVCGKNAAGDHVCLPGATTKVCDDSNICTDDSCDKNKGCVQLPNAATEVCYSGAKGTAGVGTCSKGVRYCKAGKLGSTCEGEVTPSAKEACDGKDDSCNGITDEGCKAGSVAGSFATAFATVKGSSGKKQELMMELGGSSPTGRAQGKSKRLEAGFISWLQGLLK